MRISASDQVVAWLAGLPPDPKRRVRRALRHLAAGRGDIRQLERELSGFHRLRVGGYRIVFHYEDEVTIRLDFAEERSVVYETLIALLHRAARESRE